MIYTIRIIFFSHKNYLSLVGEDWVWVGFFFFGWFGFVCLSILVVWVFFFFFFFPIRLIFGAFSRLRSADHSHFQWQGLCPCHNGISSDVSLLCHHFFALWHGYVWGDNIVNPASSASNGLLESSRMERGERRVNSSRGDLRRLDLRRAEEIRLEEKRGETETLNFCTDLITSLFLCSHSFLPSSLSAIPTQYN